METQMEGLKETAAAPTAGASARPRKETPKAVLEKPAKFTGEKGKTAPVLHTWLFRVRQYLEACEVPPAQWVVHAAAPLDKGAQLWYEMYGTVTNPDQVEQAVWHYNAKLAAPVVAPHTAEDFPWQRPLGGEPPVDEFELLRRGKESSLAHRLTRSVFDARLRMAANNKAAGSDMFTNELLKHLPNSHKDMLFSFYQLAFLMERFRCSMYCLWLPTSSS